MRSNALLILPILLETASAFQFPFDLDIPFFKSRLNFKAKGVAPVVEDAVDLSPPRIAVIGAGAAGSSAAFWISKAQERFGLDVEIDIYEKESHIGGRSTVVHPYEDASLPPLELGASLFVKSNLNLWRASDEFNLTRRSFDGDSAMGIWDGENLLFTLQSGGWWDTLKVLWRYGYSSPKRTNDFMKEMRQNIFPLYSANHTKWDNISDLASSVGWSEAAAHSASEYLQAKGVSKKYLHELLEAATRVNYGQNADVIHALEGVVSMASEGAASILGGNYLIFEQFIAKSGARVFLNTTVKELAPRASKSKPWTLTSDGGSINYKAVIFAAPFHSTSIIVPESISKAVPKQPYVHLHVTLLTTTSPYPNPSYFGFSTGTLVPKMMLTTYEGARNGGKAPEFNSIGYVGLVKEGEYAVKFFSTEKLSDEWLNAMFENIGWVHRKEWDAYPQLPPTTTFPPVKLDRGVYYINAFEPLISTMETETLSSRNVVDLMLSDEFGSGICGPRISSSEPQPLNRTEGGQDHKDFVYGWDC